MLENVNFGLLDPLISPKLQNLSEGTKCEVPKSHSIPSRRSELYEYLDFPEYI